MSLGDLKDTVKNTEKSKRYVFIDFTRGLIMAIMAWDHVSGFWNQYHHGGEGILGRAPSFINLTWFLARFVSHFCAPIFIFLAGTVLVFSVAKRLREGESELDVSLHIIIRGILLLVFEVILVSPAFGLPPTYFGVIACIGVCLILFSVARKLPAPLILAVSLIIILNHSFLSLDWIPSDVWWGWYLRVIIHEPNFDWMPWVGLYPIIPWIGVMGLGWSLGIFISEKSVDEVKKYKPSLFVAGVVSVTLFFVVRMLNGYGNLIRRNGDTIIDWLYVSKYPPSIAFLLWSLGGMCIFMAAGLHIQEKEGVTKIINEIITAFGRTPLFFYLTHLWLYKLRAPGPVPAPFYLDLLPTIGFWLIGLLVLWQLCVRYEKIKKEHPRFLQYV